MISNVIEFQNSYYIYGVNVLYISNRLSVNKNEAATWLQKFCEPEDLTLRTNLFEAKKFLEFNIIAKNKHLDFIITDWEFGLNNAKELLNWIRESIEVYSDSNFQFKSIPVLLIENKSNQSSDISNGFDGTIVDFPNNVYSLKNIIKGAIKNWRYLLADDLELIGLDPKTQVIYPGQRKAFISYFRLNVLSRIFVDNRSKRLNYIWTIDENADMFNSNDKFQEKIYKVRLNPPKLLEKQFHDFFKENPTFIKGEQFSLNPEELLYERHFYKNGSKSYNEPDFINKPLIHSMRSPEVFEIKRNTERFYRKSSEKFLVKFKKAVEQVRRYKYYMASTDPINQYYIKLYLGELYNSYEYSLLMGSSEEKDEHSDFISQLREEFDFKELNVITYEELLYRHIRLCDRLIDFNIFN